MTDSRVVFTVVCLIGVFAIGGLAGLVYLIALDKPSADLALIAGATGTALGGLTAMLVSTRSADAPPQQVQVVNEPADAVPVEPT